MSMPSEPAEQLEIAHVLFLDIVKFSTHPMDQQLQLIQRLKEIIRGTNEFRRFDGGDQLIRLPTGDGMALVFFGDPGAPARCALEICHALKLAPELKLRMGIHSGPVIRNMSVDDRVNVTGSGINMAQRVMDCGDAGHILVSSAVADVLSELRTWKERLYDLGETLVKHEVSMRIYNLCTGELGNPELPKKLSAARAPASNGEQQTATASTPHTAQPNVAAVTSPTPPPPAAPPLKTAPAPADLPAVAAKPLMFALLYKRNAQPDEHVLQLLETQLRAHGHKVFIDRHLKIGVEWAAEIAKQVSTADAVVPLLSQASVTSEMLAYEVQIAHEAAQKNNGKPRLLPVRIKYQDALPEPLSGILHPIQYELWDGPQDDGRLVTELLEAVRTPPRHALKGRELEAAGGAVPLDSKFYIERPTDEKFCEAIARHDSIVLVKGARQMGKTSLLARGLHQARQAGTKVVLTDFQKLNDNDLRSVETLFQTLAEWIGDQLDLDVMPDEVWNPKRGPNRNFERYLQHVVLSKIQAPLVWGLDEVDRLFTCSYGSEVFGLFRSWHNERAFDPTGPWGRLTLAISYATEAHLFITDINQSPFNVGTRITLDDFTFDEVAELNRRYGSPLQGIPELTRFYGLLSGHPYLVRRGLNELAGNGMGLASFEQTADRDEGPFGDHLRRFLVLLARDPALCDIVRDVLRGRPCPTRESFYRLRSAGVMAGDSEDDVRPRCRLYQTYLSRHLL